MISGKILRDAIISGANNINNQRSRVDELNVFPVPDGDTGTNMGMTIGASVRELQALDDRLHRGGSLQDCCFRHAARRARQLRRDHQPAVPRFLQGSGGQERGRRGRYRRRPEKGRRGCLQGRHEAHRGHHPHRGPRSPARRLPPADAADIPALWDVVPERRPRKRWRTPPTCCLC